MAKDKKIIFFCQNCGYESAKWMGQCPSCRQWNTMVEEPVASKNEKRSPRSAGTPPVSLSEIDSSSDDRIVTGIKELDRVLGGGIVRGGLILVGGDPGIGKSTLLLQLCRVLADSEKNMVYRKENKREQSEHLFSPDKSTRDTQYSEIMKVRSTSHNILYVSGEESLRQIKMRASRIGKFGDSLKLLCETSLDVVISQAEKSSPDLIIIDSIQTMYNEQVASSPGSVSQVRESTAQLLQLAKSTQTSIFIVGHVTKEGNVAGPRVLEHMVDTVLYFEGDRYASYRILRAAKNRFGSTNEIGVFEMREEGLVEIPNPSEYMLEGRPVGVSGSVVACSMEGTRPVMMEIQALVSRSNFGMPRRTANGTDYNRVNLLMAVLEKRAGLDLSTSDAYVNITGGIKMTEPAVDLAILLAIASSRRDFIVDENTVVFGEVGLSGEIRSVSQALQRVLEAAKLGFKKVILPKSSMRALKGNEPGDIELIPVSDIRELLNMYRK